MIAGGGLPIRDRDETLNYRSADGEVFEVEIVEEPSRLSGVDRERLISQMNSITSSAWAHADETVLRWLEQSDIVLLASSHGIAQGLSTGRYLEEDVIFFPATMVAPDSANKGLAAFMNKTILLRAFRYRIKKSGWRVWRWMKPIHVVFRTPNPIMYKIVSSRMRVFPSPWRKYPTPRELEIANRVATTLCPGFEFDANTFVSKRIGTPSELVYDPSDVPWSGDVVVDDFFRENLEFGEGKEKEFIVVGTMGSRLLEVLR
jgi:hypothetical protein